MHQYKKFSAVMLTTAAMSTVITMVLQTTVHEKLGQLSANKQQK